VATQFLLYSLGWLLCGTLLREQRAAVFHWAGFMALLGMAFLLTTQRTGDPRWVPYAGSSLAFVAAFLLVRRGMQRFLGTRRRDREDLLIFGFVVVALAVIGADPAHATARVVLTRGVSALILLRTLVDALPAVRAEYGARVMWVLATPPILRVVGLVADVIRQLAQPERLLELRAQSTGDLGENFGYLVAAALFNLGFMTLVTLRLVRRLQAQSERDALTGVFNRRALDRDLEREWQRWQRGGASFAVLSLDLDHFKQVNDTHGHLAGDRVLAQASQRLVGQARVIDTVARTGGEEFLLLMPQADAAGARSAAERLCGAVGGMPFDLGDTQRVVTASVGVVLVDERDADLTQLLLRADQALYAAKKGGRNRVSVGEPG